ncbi:MAG: ribonuclease H [Cytophagales bacterium]|nr:MAG: ribonuclease H [Cytophagales bacterium]
MAKKQKYYVVWKGHQQGIFEDWETCQKQVKNFPEAQFKSFDTYTEAQLAYKEGYWLTIQKYKKENKPTSSINVHTYPQDDTAICVDAACNMATKQMEYKGVWLKNKKIIFQSPVYEGATNNIGEFLAIVHALAWLERENQPTTTIYSDSQTAIAWVRKKKANTKIDHTPENQTVRELIARAEKWLKEHNHNHSILKWQTEQWGEIPADYGRK